MYDYEIEKSKLFTESGQRTFLKVRDEVKRLIAEAGAFEMFKPLKGITGDTWEQMANIDRLVELGEIREITGPNVAGQNRVFVGVE